MNEKRKEVVAENPTLKATEVAKMLGQLWRELPAEERKVHELKAAEDKIRYHEVRVLSVHNL